MPTYDYQCNGCGHEFEFIQSMNDEPIKTCPYCKQETVVRKISGGTGVIFKGSGFYKTDYSIKEESKLDKSTNTSCCPDGCCNH